MITIYQIELQHFTSNDIAKIELNCSINKINK